MPRRTKSGKKTAVADVEDKLKAEYGNNKGAVYGTLNKIGLMRGNKTTQKGARPARMKSGKGADPKADVRQTHPPMKRKKSVAKK